MPHPPHRDRPAEGPVDEGRERILAAAREVLHLDDLASFSLDAVAQRAGVTRMTVYNRFGSKAGLLEALFDQLVERGAFRQMRDVFTEPDIGKAVNTVVGIFGRFYTENRAVMASLSSVAGADPDLDAAMRSRNARRRQVIEALMLRLGKEHVPAVPPEEVANTADVLLNFSTFNALAGPSRTPGDVVPLVQRLLRGLLGLPAAASARRAKGKSARKPPPHRRRDRSR